MPPGGRTSWPTKENGGPTWTYSRSINFFQVQAMTQRGIKLHHQSHHPLMTHRGFKRISGLIYEETHGVLKFFSLSVWSSYLCGLPLVDPCQLLFLWWSELWVIHTTWYIYSNITWHLELIKGIPWPWEVNQDTLFLSRSVLHVISTSQINYW